MDRQRASQPSDLASRRARARSGNLPSELTSFIGRSVELACVREMLGEARLLTLVCAGGCGKTRLAKQSAASALEQFPDGVWWVELAALQDPELVGATVVEALGLREHPGQAPVEVLCDQLRDQRALLVLDNCEHVLDATAKLVDSLLRSCPELVILATSREALGVPGESTYRVPTLNLVAPSGVPNDAMQSDALRLFVDRAVLARPDFVASEDNVQAMQAICSGLDGIPLAIELAAARMRMLSPQRIADELGDRFHLLTGNGRLVAARHQTLRASIDWSYELCTECERVLLRRLSVWRGGWTLEGAEAVSAGGKLERRAVLDVLRGLVDKSLVDTQDRAGEMRYGMLETIRQYAAERLAEAGEVDATHARHLAWCLELVERAEPQLVRHDARTWLDRLEIEDGNLRTALERATVDDVDAALRLAAAMTFFWLMRGRLEEGTAAMERVLCNAPKSSALRGRVRWGISYLNIQLRYDRFPACFRYAEQALQDGEAAGDTSLIARARGAMNILILNDLWPDHGREALNESLARAREAHDEWFAAEATRMLAWSHVRQGEHELARPILEDAHALARGLGYGPMHAAYFQMRAWGELEHGNLRAARELAAHATAISIEIGEPLTLGLATALLVECDVLQGRPAEGRARGESCVELMRSTGTRDAQLWIECALALADIAQGSPSGARDRIEAARCLIPQPGWIFDGQACSDDSVRITDQRARVRRPLCVALLSLGDLDGARDEAQQMLAHAHTSSNERVEATARDLLGRVALARGSIVEAEDQLQQSLAIAVRRDFRVQTINGLESLARVAALTDSPTQAARLLAAVTVARQQSEIVRWPPEPEVWAAVQRDVRVELGDDAFAIAWQSGLALSLDAAAQYARRGRGQRKRPKHGWESLTPTELQVVAHVAAGMTNPQIAQRTLMSRATVKNHLSHIFAKLDAPNRQALTAEATRRGLDAPDIRM